MSKSSITTNTTKGLATSNRVTTHPGEVLSEEFLNPFGMSVNALAMALRVPSTRIGAIVKGERSVTADTALRLARFSNRRPDRRRFYDPVVSAARRPRNTETVSVRTSPSSRRAKVLRSKNSS